MASSGPLLPAVSPPFRPQSALGSSTKRPLEVNPRRTLRQRDGRVSVVVDSVDRPIHDPSNFFWLYACIDVTPATLRDLSGLLSRLDRSIAAAVGEMRLLVEKSYDSARGSAQRRKGLFKPGEMHDMERGAVGLMATRSSAGVARDGTGDGTAATNVEHFQRHVADLLRTPPLLGSAQSSGLSLGGGPVSLATAVRAIVSVADTYADAVVNEHLLASRGGRRADDEPPGAAAGGGSAGGHVVDGTANLGAKGGEERHVEADRASSTGNGCDPLAESGVGWFPRGHLVVDIVAQMRLISASRRGRGTATEGGRGSGRAVSSAPAERPRHDGGDSASPAPRSASGRCLQTRQRADGATNGPIFQLGQKIHQLVREHYRSDIFGSFVAVTDDTLRRIGRDMYVTCFPPLSSKRYTFDLIDHEHLFIVSPP